MMLKPVDFNLKIEIVSDVVCPWCLVGYRRLLKALKHFEASVYIQLVWKPFLLNPQTPSGGRNHYEHLNQKYGMSIEQNNSFRQQLIQLGKKLDFSFHFHDSFSTYNTFKAQLLLMNAAESGLQTALKERLFLAYFCEAKAMDCEKTLIQEAESIGIKRKIAIKVLSEEKYTRALKKELREIVSISGVPTFIFNEKIKIEGAAEEDSLIQAIKNVLNSQK